MPAKHIDSYILLFLSFFVLFRSQGLSVRKYLTMKSSELRNEPTTADKIQIIMSKIIKPIKSDMIAQSHYRIYFVHICFCNQIWINHLFR